MRACNSYLKAYPIHKEKRSPHQNICSLPRNTYGTRSLDQKYRSKRRMKTASNIDLYTYKM